MIVLFTSALIEENYELRKIQYLKSIDSLAEYIDKKKIKIIECYDSDTDFFNELDLKLFLSKSNNSFRNKGAKECDCLRYFLLNNDFIDDNELIIKLTGRYQILSNIFFSELTNNLGYDFYGKLMDGGSQIFTGFFGIKKKFLFDFLNTVNLDKMENEMINVERLIKEYVDSNRINSHFIKNLGLRALIYGNGVIDEQIL